MLLSISENREHLKNFRNVDCVLANRNKVRDTQANLKPQINYRVAVCGLVISRRICRNTITFHKYFWCSRFCEFHSKELFSGMLYLSATKMGSCSKEQQQQLY